MVVETTRDNISVNHIIGQKTENFMVQSDSIIPDIKPDIINDIFTSGTVCIYKKEITEGKVRLGRRGKYIYSLWGGSRRK